MLVWISIAAVGLVWGKVLGEAPYPPSGWKPQGAILQLPKKEAQLSNQYGPPPQPPSQYGPPPKDQYGPPPKDQYGPPPKDQYGPPPKDQYGPPPKDQYGPPPQPPSQYGPPPQPPSQYGPPPKDQYGPPPKDQYGPPPQPPSQYGPPPAQPPSEYGPPGCTCTTPPPDEYGPPTTDGYTPPSSDNDSTPQTPQEEAGSEGGGDVEVTGEELKKLPGFAEGVYHVLLPDGRLQRVRYTMATVQSPPRGGQVGGTPLRFRTTGKKPRARLQEFLVAPAESS